jgi:arginyl-tRNA synthetase
VKDSNPNVNDLLDGYKKVNDVLENDHSLQEEVDEIIRQYEKGDPDTIRNIRMICTVILNSITESLSRIGIKIDDYTWESDLIRAGDVDRVLESLSDKLQEEDGAKYITSLDRKMFLTRSDGTSLYFSRDIAYHLYKFQNFDWLINVLGENHKEHMKHLEYVLKDLMEIERRLDFVYYSYVSLESGRMSTRKGNMVTLDELVERAMEESMKVVKEKRPDLPIDKLNEIADSVAISAIRFQLVKLNANKTLVFKWSEALSLEGDSAPFIMYSYARAASILRKLEEPETAISQEYDSSESALIRQMYFYPYAIEEAFRGLKPESVANYLLELTRRFNDFYTNCPVVNAKEKDRSKRVLIIHLYKNIVKDASNIMGIKILEEM